MGRVTASGSGDRPVLVVLAAGMAKRYGGCKPLAPLGLHGEAVIDLIAGDARGRRLRRHRPRPRAPDRAPPSATTWAGASRPRVEVAFAEQRVPLGTAHAVLCARKHVGDGPFAVVNADDVYGAPALALLARHLAEGDEHAIVAYRLRDTVVADDPVTRGTCEVEARRAPGAPGGAAQRGPARRREPSTSATASSRPCSRATPPCR